MLSRETPLFIQGPAGQLEALLLEVADARGVALVCHPNPVQGGTMLNKVVSTLQRTARDCGYHTLRFNYRGVGASAGSHDMGTGEVDDALAVVQQLHQTRVGIDIAPLPLHSRNASPLYDAVACRGLADRLFDDGGAWRRFYGDDDLRRTLAELERGA